VSEKSGKLGNETGWRVPGIPDHLEELGLCILFHLTLPFLPLITEAVVLGRVEHKTYLLFLALYPLSIGVSSRSRLMFGATVILSLFYSTLFGLVSGSTLLAPNIYTSGGFCLTLMILIHLCERYNRHVVEREPFWEFVEAHPHVN
jgi:hypothetical protein